MQKERYILYKRFINLEGLTLERYEGEEIDLSKNKYNHVFRIDLYE